MKLFQIFKLILVDFLLFFVFFVLLAFVPSLLRFPFFLLASFALYKVNLKLIRKPEEEKTDA